MPVFAMQSLYKQHEMQSPVNLTGSVLREKKTGGISLPFLLVITYYLVLMETEKHILFLMFFNIIIQSTTFRDYEMSLTL